jgi:thioredoxin 1
MENKSNMSELVQGITDANFNENIQSGVVLVDFWAEWCGPCNMLTPIIEEVAQELKDKVKIYKMNLDHNPNTPSSLGVRSIPTLILFKDGKQVSNQVGLLSKVQLKNWIESSI